MFSNRILIVSIIICNIFFYGCNAVSSENISNHFKWKKHKFDNQYEISLNYEPTIVNSIDTYDPVFYSLEDSINPDINYEILKSLKEKLKFRNIIISNESNVKVVIDTLIFREYSEAFSVYTEYNNNEYIGDSEKDYFEFKITGSILRDSINVYVESEKKHNTFPRESYTISGVIVKDGIKAKASKMLENTINEFSYRIYKNLNEKK
ncbi:MAG: hypothetical protein GYB35_03940 [Algicola sp.]|nr:hypothetical protein [Algicola sp.]